MKLRCKEYEVVLEIVTEKSESSSEKVQGAASEGKLQELRNDTKKEKEHQKVHYKEIVKQQVQDSTKQAVIWVIKGKENLASDAADKKCTVIWIRRKKF